MRKGLKGLNEYISPYERVHAFRVRIARAGGLFVLSIVVKRLLVYLS